jgi:hypothetical protein
LYFAYHHDAYSYVERAQKQLQLFDAGNPESLFYAAFELRTGIEARLYDGLRALLQYNLTEEERKKHAERIEKLSIDKLFRKLATIDENTLQSYTVMIGSPGDQSTTILQYIGVTKELAKDWTRVSQLLHYRFFLDNKEWYHKEKIYSNKDNMKSLMDYYAMLGDIAKRLEEASRGDLLTPPPFLLKLVEELDEGGNNIHR